MFWTPVEARPALDEASVRALSLWEPPPEMMVSQWAESYRIMPKGTTSRPGPWKTEVFQRDMMNVFDDPEVHEIVVVKCTQIGWSEILNNIIGKHIHVDPKPMMLVQPSLDDAKGYGKKRITPMVEACPVLRERVKRSTSRRAGNTLLLKEFPGGFLKLTGANSGKGLRSDPLPIVMYDEADAMPDDVDGEGHPFDIGDNRTEGYSDYKTLKGSTPAKPKGIGRLEALWEKSDKRRFQVPCPHCGHLQVLWWRDPATGQHRLTWEKDHNGDVIPESVRYICAGCGQGIQERHKQRMLDGGHWIAEAPGRPVVGFHINALYRPWKENWAAMAQKWVDAQGDHEKLKEFIMLQLAEFWEESGERLEPGDLTKRCEAYPVLPGKPDDAPRPWDYEMIPRAAAVLTCSGDVQETRIEAKIKAWGGNGESWLIAHEVFWGNPSSDASVWEAFDAFRVAERMHESGARVRPIITVVDSGDQSDAVYDYVQPRQNLRDCVFAVKGVPFHTKPVLVQEGTAKRTNIRLFTIATHAAKERVFARLKLAAPGAGYMHFPLWTTEEYFAQLTSEKKITVTNKHTRVKKVAWVKTHTRNEALDLEVMNLAAIFILQHILDPQTFSDLGLIAAALRGEAKLPSRQGNRRVRSRGVE
jgi:phage terminase large subunit GpA-like protein